MTNFEKIKNLIEQNNWEEVEYIFSTMKCFKEDRDGNPEYLDFFQNNISQAIVLAEKYNLISQSDIIFSLRFTSTDFRKTLTYNLLEMGALDASKVFKDIIEKKGNLSTLIIGNQKTFLFMINYYKENNVKNILDSETLKTIFLNEENINIVNNNLPIFKFMLHTSNINDYFFFNNCLERKNYSYLSLIVNRYKEEKNDLDFDIFNTNTKESLLFLENKIKHPFTSSQDKTLLTIIVEDINKINLFLSFKNNYEQTNKKNRHKI